MPFFTGFLTYVIGKKELKDIINLAVVVGFICYTGAQVVLLLEIGQPIRGWFSFWHPNVHSMLTEVIFCITLYTMVLTVEYIPLILENRQLDKVPEFHYFSHNLHEIMVVFAATGTFLSFFHQGSLGGLYGVMFARPFAFRAGFFIWPWTFFLFVASAIASGPALTILVCKMVQGVSRKQLVRREAISLLAKVTGYLLTFYLIFKFLDTWWWATQTAPKMGMSFTEFFQGPYGMWLLVAELGICGVLPAVILLIPKAREDDVLTNRCLRSELHRHSHQSFRLYHSEPGVAGIALRRATNLHSHLDGVGTHCWRAGIWCFATLTFLPLSAHVPKGERAKSHRLIECERFSNENALRVSRGAFFVSPCLRVANSQVRPSRINLCS